MTNQGYDLDRLCGHVVRVAGAFAVAVAAVLVLVTLRSWVANPTGAGGLTLPVLESAQMRELKARLIASPKDECIKKEIRQLDLMLRAEQLRGEAMVVRGGWLLLAALTLVMAAAHVMTTLRKRPHLPSKKACPEGGELSAAGRGRWAVGVLTVALGAGGGLLAINSAGRLPRNFTQALGQEGPARPATQPAGPNGQQASPQVVAADFPTPAEIARNWPRFRGPGGSGVSAFTNVPAEWDVKTDKNIAWRTPIPMPGTSSPIIWGNRVFVTGCGVDKDKAPKEEAATKNACAGTPQTSAPTDTPQTQPATQASTQAAAQGEPEIPSEAGGEEPKDNIKKWRREVYCLDLATGKLLWTTRVEVPGAKLPENYFDDTGYAASTPVTDGRRVYAIFATGELAALDLEGKLVWQKNLGPPKNSYGHASSLEMYKGRLFVQYDQGDPEEKLSAMFVFDAATGNQMQKIDRSSVVQSWTSPILISTPGGDQFVTVANEWVIAYNPADGSEIWRAGKVEGDGAPSPIYAGGLVLAGNVGSRYMAIKPDGKGDVSQTHVLWGVEDNLPDICSPVSDGQRLYLVTSDCLLTCVSLKDGKKLWDLDIENQHATPSPSVVGDRIYLPTKKGAVLIVSASSEKGKVLGRMELGEPSDACPAFADGKIVFRTKKHLLCVEKK